jgi:cell wall assembly regulator SMI1
MTDRGLAPVDISFQRIEAWLAVHAPASLEHLNPPATRGEIEATERVLGAQLPVDSVQSLACHNGLRGWANLLPEHAPLPADAIAQRWQSCMQTAAEEDGSCAAAMGRKTLVAPVVDSPGRECRRRLSGHRPEAGAYRSRLTRFSPTTGPAP